MKGACRTSEDSHRLIGEVEQLHAVFPLDRAVVDDLSPRVLAVGRWPMALACEPDTLPGIADVEEMGVESYVEAISGSIKAQAEPPARIFLEIKGQQSRDVTSSQSPHEPLNVCAGGIHVTPHEARRSVPHRAVAPRSAAWRSTLRGWRGGRRFRTTLGPVCSPVGVAVYVEVDVGERPPVGAGVGVSHVDVVVSGARVQIAPPLLCPRVKEARRSGEDADHLQEKPDHLRMGPTIDRATVDDVIRYVLICAPLPMALAYEPDTLTHKADPRGMRADLHPEVAVRPVEAHAELVLANLSDIFEGQETGRLAVPNPAHQVHKELRARETHPSLLIKAIETWQSLSRRPRTPKPPAHQLSHIRLHISQEHTLMELSYTQTHYRHTPPGHPATGHPGPYRNSSL